MAFERKRVRVDSASESVIRDEVVGPWLRLNNKKSAMSATHSSIATRLAHYKQQQQQQRQHSTAAAAAAAAAAATRQPLWQHRHEQPPTHNNVALKSRLSALLEQNRQRSSWSEPPRHDDLRHRLQATYNRLDVEPRRFQAPMPYSQELGYSQAAQVLHAQNQQLRQKLSMLEIESERESFAREQDDALQVFHALARKLDDDEAERKRKALEKRLDDISRSNGQIFAHLSGGSFVAPTSALPPHVDGVYRPQPDSHRQFSNDGVTSNRAHHHAQQPPHQPQFPHHQHLPGQVPSPQHITQPSTTRIPAVAPEATMPVSPPQPDVGAARPSPTVSPTDASAGTGAGIPGFIGATTSEGATDDKNIWDQIMEDDELLAMSDDEEEEKKKEEEEAKRKAEAKKRAAYKMAMSEMAKPMYRWRKDGVQFPNPSDVIKGKQLFRSIAFCIIMAGGTTSWREKGETLVQHGTYHGRVWRVMLENKLRTKEDEANDMEETLQLYRDVVKRWILTTIKVPLQSVTSNKALLMDPGGKSVVSASSFLAKVAPFLARGALEDTPKLRAMRLKVRVRGVLDLMLKSAHEKKGVSPGIVAFLRRIVSDGNYFPAGYLFDEEVAILDVSKIGCTRWVVQESEGENGQVKVDFSRAKVLLLNYVFTRMVIDVLLHPWHLGHGRRPPRQVRNNLRVLATAIYTLVCSAIADFTQAANGPVMPQAGLTLRADELDAMDKHEEDDDEGILGEIADGLQVKQKHMMTSNCRKSESIVPHVSLPHCVCFRSDAAADELGGGSPGTEGGKSGVKGLISKLSALLQGKGKKPPKVADTEAGEGEGADTAGDVSENDKDVVRRRSTIAFVKSLANVSNTESGGGADDPASAGSADIEEKTAVHYETSREIASLLHEKEHNGDVDLSFLEPFKLLLELWVVRMLHRALASTEATPLPWIRQLEDELDVLDAAVTSESKLFNRFHTGEDVAEQDEVPDHIARLSAEEEKRVDRAISDAKHDIEDAKAEKDASSASAKASKSQTATGTSKHSGSESSSVSNGTTPAGGDAMLHESFGEEDLRSTARQSPKSALSDESRGSPNSRSDADVDTDNEEKDSIDFIGGNSGIDDDGGLDDETDHDFGEETDEDNLRDERDAIFEEDGTID